MRHNGTRAAPQWTREAFCRWRATPWWHEGMQYNAVGMSGASCARWLATVNGKSHPLEGSCQEAILLPSTTFDILFVAFRSAHSTPA